jgi:hypothetical protein
MQELNKLEIDNVSGGIPLFGAVALAAFSDTAIYGPLGWAFGAGFAIGTIGYHYFAD